VGKQFAQMEDQIPASQPPLPPQITPEQLEAMKARARELAIQQTLAEQASSQRPAGQQPQVVYVRRNLTVAELLLVILLSCGIVTGIQWSWNTITNLLPKIEIRVR
jgi:hypothetical protein